ncbi:MAG: hypothetical protein HYU56_05190 [Candidatus Aenigmarchaeota archaeon]|nr:hypothetical protein [Candidatus Aenigmarchaeota archaeon]
MSLEFIALTIEIIGELLIAVSVLLVHGRVSSEKKIDKHAFREMKKEKYIVIAGIALILASYFLRISWSIV